MSTFKGTGLVENGTDYRKGYNKGVLDTLNKLHTEIRKNDI